MSIKPHVWGNLVAHIRVNVQGEPVFSVIAAGWVVKSPVELG